MHRLELKCGDRMPELVPLSTEDFCTRLREVYGPGAPLGNMSAQNLILVDSARVYPQAGFRRNFFISFRRELDIREDDFLLCPVDVNLGVILELFIRMEYLKDVYIVGKMALDRVFEVKIVSEDEYPVDVLSTVEPIGEDRMFHIYPSYSTWVKRRGARNAVTTAST